MRMMSPRKMRQIMGRIIIVVTMCIAFFVGTRVINGQTSSGSLDDLFNDLQVTSNPKSSTSSRATL